MVIILAPFLDQEEDAKEEETICYIFMG